MSEVCAAFCDKYQKWCAYQIAALKDDSSALVALNWFADDKPAQEHLASLPSLPLCAFSWDQLATPVYFTGTPVPEGFLYIGAMPLRHTGPISAYSSSWPPSFHPAAFEYRWTTYPAHEYLRYKQPQASKAGVQINKQRLM